MKSLILIALLYLVFTQNISNINDEDTYGCIIPEGEFKCCWRNNNGCCQPPSPEQICTMVFTDCCKTKVYEGKNGTYNYEYSHLNSSPINLRLYFSFTLLFILLLV